MANPIYHLYQTLLQHYGSQSWWPAESTFEVMIGAVLTQNTAWTNVEKAITNLKNNSMLSSNAILGVTDEQLAEFIRPSGYFNVKAKRLKSLCSWYQEHNGFNGLSQLNTSLLRNKLLAVHGVGPETADDILLYAFERPVFVIDSYARRLFSRTDCADSDETYNTLRILVEKALDYNLSDLNEFHALIVCHAKQHCKKHPDCQYCPVNDSCDYHQGKVIK